MLLYTTLGTNDLPRALAFYDPVFQALGHARLPDWSGDSIGGWAAWGQDYDSGISFCLCPPYDGQPATPGNGTMIAFRARDADDVRRFHAAGLAHGGRDEGAPGLRAEYGPHFYVAYLRDPDGNKLAAVFHPYDAARDG